MSGWVGGAGGGGGRGLAGEGPRRQHLGFASFRLLPLDGRHVGEKAEDGVTDLMSLWGDGDRGERPETSWTRNTQRTDGRTDSDLWFALGSEDTLVAILLLLFMFNKH